MNVCRRKHAKAGCPTRISRLPEPAMPVRGIGAVPTGAGSAGSDGCQRNWLSRAASRFSERSPSAPGALPHRSTLMHRAPGQPSMSAPATAHQRSPSAAPDRYPAHC